MAPLTGSCLRLNASHCGNQDGDVTCVERGGAQMYCNVCVEQNDGCVDEAPTPSCSVGAAASASSTGADGSGTSSVTQAATSASVTSTTSADPTGSATGSPTDGPETGDESSGGPSGPACGNGIVEPPEQCEDGSVPCTAFNAGDTDAMCNEDCIYDISTCSEPPECGDSVVEPPEDCEPGMPVARSCEEVARGYFVGGELGCTKECTYDTNDCELCIAANSPTRCSEDNDECCPGSTCACTGLPGIDLVCRCAED
ncbi:MAG: hypothetical protein ACE37F_38120 [Nannocystaceae bacterium]|nr:hypothetical protein [bacterium]